MGVSPLSRFRDSLPPRHWRAARHRATGFIAPELVSICTQQGGCQASDLAHGGKQILALSPPPHTHSPRTAPRALPPASVWTTPATTRAATSRSAPPPPS